MTRPAARDAPSEVTALLATRRLAGELERLGIGSRVVGDDRLALLIVCNELTVWCLHGLSFNWWAA
jgi:hypothetical protein